MADQVRLYIPTEGANEGDVVELYGPDANGAIDWSRAVRGSRRTVCRGPVGLGRDAPSGIGPAGTSTRRMRTYSGPQVFGQKTFGVKRYDRLSGLAASGTPGTVQVFINSAPLQSSGLTVVAELQLDGKLKFTFTRGAF